MARPSDDYNKKKKNDPISKRVFSKEVSELSLEFKRISVDSPRQGQESETGHLEHASQPHVNIVDTKSFHINHRVRSNFSPLL